MDLIENGAKGDPIAAYRIFLAVCKNSGRYIMPGVRRLSIFECNAA